MQGFTNELPPTYQILTGQDKSLSCTLLIRIRSVTEQVVGDYSGERMVKTNVITEAKPAPQRKVEC